MKKTTILLTLCLLLTAPYILGGEDAHYGNEAQVPTLKAPKANGRKWYTVDDSEKKAKAVERAAQQAYLQTPDGKAELAELRKKISLRKQRLLLKGDVELMNQARIQNGTFQTDLPLSVNTQQGPRSRLARFVKNVITASGLSKTQAKKIVKTMFPTKGMMMREALRYGVSLDAIRAEYAMRQMTLHAHLHSITSPQELRATVEETLRYHTEQAELNQLKLDELGGYISLADARKKYYQDVRDLKEARKDFFRKKLDKIAETEAKLKDWLTKPGVVTATTWQELDINIGKNRRLLHYQGKGKEDLHLEVIKPNLKKAKDHYHYYINSVSSNGSGTDVDDMKALHPKLYTQLQEREAEFKQMEQNHSKLPATVAYKRLNRHLDFQDHFEEVSESWKHWDALNIGEAQAWSCVDKSRSFVRARFIDMQLMGSEEDYESLPLQHHPSMIWHEKLSPESLSLIMRQKVTDDKPFISISRKNAKLAFKGYWDQTGLNNIRELSTALGLPTRVEDKFGTHKLSAKELRKQWKSSSLQLSLPTGVLVNLGQEFNDFFNESDIYRQNWGDTMQLDENTNEMVKVYDWKALRVEEAELVKAEEELDDLLDGFF